MNAMTPGNGSKAGDKLDRILRRDAAALVDDDGFTARVMQSLPRASATRARPAWLTRALVLGSTALGSALAYAFAPEGSGAVQGFIDLASERLTTAAIGTLATTCALVACAVVLATTTD